MDRLCCHQIPTYYSTHGASRAKADSISPGYNYNSLKYGILFFYLGSQTNYIVDWLAESESHFLGHSISIMWPINNLYTTVTWLLFTHYDDINRSSWPRKWEFPTNNQSKSINWSESWIYAISNNVNHWPLHLMMVMVASCMQSDLYNVKLSNI